MKSDKNISCITRSATSVLFILWSVFFLLSCVTNQEIAERKARKIQLMKRIEGGVLFLELQRWEEAVAAFHSILKEKDLPAEAEDVMTFNIGLAYEGAGQCKASENVFQKLLKKENLNSAFRARSYLRLGYVYECLLNFKLSRKYWRRAQSLVGYLSTEKTQVEIPLRLAASHYKEGNLLKTEKFLRVVDRSLKTLPNSEAIYNTLIGASRISTVPLSNRTFVYYMKNQVFFQRYLALVTKVLPEGKSDSAQGRLSDSYLRVSDFLSTLSPKDRSPYKPLVVNSIKELEKAFKNSKSKKIKKILSYSKKTLSLFL